MVKNDALFSYIAPSNIFAWLLLPLRYCLPLQQFVWLNRFVIKMTHFPLLFCIYIYERFWLAPAVYDPTDLVEHAGRGRPRNLSLVDPAGRSALFSPNVRVREESVVGFQKDRALEEVFRRAPDNLKMQRQKERRKTQTAIRNWMDQADDLGAIPRNWPTINSRLGMRSIGRRNSSISRDPKTRRFRQISDVRSTASDPADILSNGGFPISRFPIPDENLQDSPLKDQTDADGDDELVTNDEDEDNITTTNTVEGHGQDNENLRGEYFISPTSLSRFSKPPSGAVSQGSSSGNVAATPRPGPSSRKALHNRTMSTNTILYNPKDPKRIVIDDSDTSSAIPKTSSGAQSIRNAGMETPASGYRSPRRALHMTAKPRPIQPPRDMARTAPRPSLLPFDTQVSAHRRPPPRRLSSVDMEITSDMGLSDPNNIFAAVPSSFATQMAMATGFIKDGRANKDSDRMSRLVLARMKTLEESFADVVREMRVMRSTATTAQNSGNENSSASEGDGAVEITGRERPKSRHTVRKGKRPILQRSQTGDGLRVSPKTPRAKGKSKGALSPRLPIAIHEDESIARGGSL